MLISRCTTTNSWGLHGTGTTMCLLYSPLASHQPTTYMFTKLLHPLVRYWLARGIRILVYLDEGLGVAVGKSETAWVSQMVRDTLSQAGFVVHPTKSIWEPTQRLTWLGVVIDLSMSPIEVSEQKLAVLKHRLQHACQSPSLLLDSVVGKIH